MSLILDVQEQVELFKKMEQHKKASIARAIQNMNKTHKCEICEKHFRG